MKNCITRLIFILNQGPKGREPKVTSNEQSPNPQGAPSKETYNIKMLEWAFDEDQLGSAKSAFEMIISFFFFEKEMIISNI